MMNCVMFMWHFMDNYSLNYYFSHLSITAISAVNSRSQNQTSPLTIANCTISFLLAMIERTVLPKVWAEQLLS